MTGNDQVRWETVFNGSAASSSAAQADTSTGNWLRRSSGQSDLRRSNAFSERLRMVSPPSQRPPSITSGRTTQPSPTLGLNSVPNHSIEPNQPTGKTYGLAQSRGGSQIYLRIFEYAVIHHSEESAQITLHQLQWSEAYQFSGAQLELGRVEELGTRPVWKLTLRIPVPNFGTDTEARAMLSSMNFVEVSTSLIYLYGVTGIQTIWKSKAHQYLQR